MTLNTDSTLHPLHSTLYTPHSTLGTPHPTLYTLHFTPHAVHFTLYTVRPTLYTVQSTLYILHLHTLHCHTLHFALHFTLHPHNLTLFTLYTVWNLGLASFPCCARAPTSRPQLRFCSVLLLPALPKVHSEAEGGPLNLPQSLVIMLASLNFLILFVQLYIVIMCFSPSSPLTPPSPGWFTSSLAVGSAPPSPRGHHQQHRQHRHSLHLYTSRFTLGKQNTLYTLHFTLPTLYFALHALHSKLYTPHFTPTLHALHFTL